MNHSIYFDRLPDYVRLVTSGDASVEGFNEMLRDLLDSPEWEPGTKQLVDHRELNGKNLTPDEVRKIMAVVADHGKKLGSGRCAFVVKDALGFGFIRMYELIGGDEIHSDMRVFYSVEEAHRWLT